MVVLPCHCCTVALPRLGSFAVVVPFCCWVRLCRAVLHRCAASPLLGCLASVVLLYRCHAACHLHAALPLSCHLATVTLLCCLASVNICFSLRGLLIHCLVWDAVHAAACAIHLLAICVLYMHMCICIYVCVDGYTALVTVFHACGAPLPARRLSVSPHCRCGPFVV